MIREAAPQQPGCNIASHLPAMARLQPHRRAVVAPAGRDAQGRVTWSHLTFAQLDQRSDAIARGLRRVGVARGTRTVLLVKPSLDFFALTFALFKLGAVIVLIDPGIGRKALVRCLDEVEPEAFVGIPAAHVARLLFRKPFRKVHTLVTVGRKLWGGHTLEDLVDPGPFEMAPTTPDEVAAILFTSGSTGIPKGAVYTHGIFDAQVRLIRALYGIEPGEIDLPTFPLFALFDPALGMTAILPDMDARFPARADPARLLEAITDHGVTNMFGSPALLDNLSRHCVARGLRLPTLRRVLSAGAPVRSDVLARTAALLDAPAQVFTPFGATESLPVCSIGSEEVLRETAAGTAAGKGICVGRPAPEMLVRIIHTSDEAIERWSDELLVPRGTVGEITVRGPVVTPGYFARPEQTRLAKIDDGGQVVHRMGDLGWEDEEGRIWMCGRKSHRVETAAGTLYPVMVEEVLNQHPAVLRTALVGVGPKGAQQPVLLVEPEAHASTACLVDELRTLAAGNAATAGIEDLRLHEKPFPVDVRHNAKIEREKLARAAAKRSAR
ncbi:fatty acid CoA ligase family protein [Vulgatibacter sp.]|uniref:fatty acid CoA ligase family protein n=1 Tax=Vulgatibacter sp. TaxID=1971226 RepID=UPI003564CFEB